jgi:integral membrane protein
MKNPLSRYRLMSIACGTTLLLLTFVYLPAEYIFKAFDQNSNWKYFSFFHGYLYIVYMLTVLQVGVQKGMTLKRMALLILAGTIPFASFIAERKIVKEYS